MPKPSSRAFINVVCDVLSESTGVAADAHTPILASLSSLDLMLFLVAVEAETGIVLNLDTIDPSDLRDVSTFVEALTRA